MSKRILVVNLKKKYKHPRRACDATGADVPWEYCVGGALCMEVMSGKEAMHFPDYDRLYRAVLIAAPQIDRNLMSDQEFAAFSSKLSEVDARLEAWPKGIIRRPRSNLRRDVLLH